VKPLLVARFAEIEAEKARLHYERKQEGVDQRFLDDLERTLDRVEAAPQRFPKVWLHYRRCLFDHFPYGVIYEDLDDCTHVVAIADLRRHPDHWKSRV
jgi:hypothetical protein